MPEGYDELEAELRALAAGLLPPARAAGGDSDWADELAGAVLLRVADEPVPAPPSVAGTAVRRAAGWLRARWRAAVAVLTSLVVVGALAPPVRATVAELFGFSGVVVQREPGPGPSTTAAPPPTAGGLTLEQARRMIDFVPLLPAGLGAPDGVEVSADRMVLSLSWNRGGRTVRLDEFDGELEPRFWKSAHQVEHVQVGTLDGLWFPAAHNVVVLDRQGTERTEPPRLAGPTLVWQTAGTTLRLEGPQTLAEALDVAGSVR